MSRSIWLAGDTGRGEDLGDGCMEEVKEGQGKEQNQRKELGEEQEQGKEQELSLEDEAGIRSRYRDTSLHLHMGEKKGPAGGWLHFGEAGVGVLHR